MTIGEALEELDTLLIPRDGEQDRLADAFEMAVEALKTVQRFETRKQELEKKLHNSFSLTEATEHYALTKLLREAENDK